MKRFFHIGPNLFSKFFNRSKSATPAGSGFELLFDFLIKEISVPKQAERLIAVGKKIKGKPADELIRNYVSFEHYLTNLDPEQKYTKERLKAVIKQRFPVLVQDHFFSLLFDTESVQKLKLVAIFTDFCLQETSAIFGNAGNGLFDQVNKQLQIAQQYTDNEASLQQMQLLIDKMFAYININFGTPLAEKVFDSAYQKTARYYKEAGIIHYLAAFLPQSIVLSSLLSDLTQAQTQKVIREKMEETQRLNHVLEQRLKQLQQTRDEVKRQESMLSGIISSSLDAMVTINEEGNIINWNRAAEDIFGYSNEEAKGQHLSDLIIPEEYVERHKEGFNRFLRTRQSAVMDKRLRLQARRKDNSLFPVEITITAIEYNNFCYFNGFLRDISEQVQKEDELKKAREVAEQASRIKTEFLNTVSHEIRTPLNAIMGFTYQLLNGKVKSEEERNKYITYLRHSSETLLHLINDVLDFNKLENGGQQLNNETFHLKELLHSIYSSFSPLAQQKNIKLLLQCDEEIPEVIHGDGARLFAVLSNLVNNAIKFTPKGSIKIETALVEANADSLIVEFMVKDTGIGIANEKQEQIFDYFIQAESNNTRRFGGAGLGLSIVRKTVQLMQGSIFLESEPGKGSVFTIRIPLQHAKDSFISEAEIPGTDNAIFTGRKILIAEDNEFNIIVAKNFIEDWGAVVDVAYNGQEALESCMKNEYHLILMDLQMPVMDGITSSEEIRKFNSSIPIIALTASSLEEIAEHVNTNSLNDYIRKPIEPNELYYKLCRYLPKIL